MFNFLKPKKLPLLDPALYPKIELAYQNKLWENHPYFFSFLWEGEDKRYSALASFSNDLLLFGAGSSKQKELRLKLLSRNNEKLKEQYLLYLEISIHRILDNLKLRAQILRDYWLSNQSEVTPFLNQAEEQNYGWLDGTLNVLTRAIEQKTKQPEYLLQYEIHFIENENEGLLKIRCYNLYFNFSIRDHQLHIMVIDSKDGDGNEQANRYDLVFMEQMPRVIDLLTKYFEFLRDNTKIDIVPTD